MYIQSSAFLHKYVENMFSFTFFAFYSTIYVHNYIKGGCDYMFPEKIKLTDEYIDLIIKERKKHGFTSYQLSEKIGKNKSWLPNIENHRTKNISKKDFLLIFNEFAKGSGFSAEKYIIKNLHPNTMIELDDKTTLPAFYIQGEFELYPPNYTDVSVEEVIKRIEYLSSEKPYSVDFATIKEALVNLSKTVLEELPFQTPKERERIFNAVKTMRNNLVNNFNITISFYEVPIMHGGMDLFSEKLGQKYAYELNLVREKYVSSIKTLYAKAHVYSYFDTESPNSYGATNLESYTDNDVKDLIVFISDIESYIYELYEYIGLSIADAQINNYEYVPEYYKLYSVATHALQTFINVCQLDYSFNFEVPSDDTAKDIIDKKQLELNNIVYSIKKEFSKKYHTDDLLL